MANSMNVDHWPIFYVTWLVAFPDFIFLFYELCLKFFLKIFCFTKQEKSNDNANKIASIVQKNTPNQVVRKNVMYNLS